ncbi:HIT domain-containing protein [Alphaproteobacteria bacterium]|nr:HIT domain-containing protein [Alphaproteobacteria bacterium]
MYDENNIFAKIIRGEVPCKKIYEDKDVLFFNDIKPLAKIHVLGIPKVSCVNFSDFIQKCEPNIIVNFFKKTKIIIDKLGISKSGYKIITNSGKNGGQEVPHYHIHILGGQRVFLNDQ